MAPETVHFLNCENICFLLNQIQKENSEVPVLVYFLPPNSLITSSKLILLSPGWKAAKNLILMEVPLFRKEDSL
jgi:hypothetical protein